ncbi:MAG: hypothetical protein HQK50_09005 [Oligoflexia bacterium]|nr:hypothetical protein [Oligoflexia bacterium]
MKIILSLSIMLLLLIAAKSFASSEPSIKVNVAPNDSTYGRCGTKFVGVYENDSLTLTITPNRFPSPQKINYRVFITWDGMEEALNGTPYSDSFQEGNSIRIKAGTLLHWMDFGTQTVMVEARDDRNNYATTSFQFRVNRHFLILKDSTHALNCAKTTEGSVVSSVYSNPTNVMRTISYSDIDTRAIEKMFASSRGVWFTLAPSYSGIAPYSYSKSKMAVKQKFKHYTIVESNHTNKSLRPEDNGVIIRRFQTNIDVYKVYNVETCGVYTYATNAIYQYTHPTYELALISNPSEDPLSQISSETLTHTSNSCSAELENMNNWIFEKLD